MKKIIIVICLLMSAAASFAQWTQQNSGTTKDLYTVCFTSQDTGYAAGLELILKTVNGGTNWTTVANLPFKLIYSMCFVNKDTGYAVGESGYIVKTNDAGLSWTQHTVSVTSALRSVCFVNPDTGYVVGDGGKVIFTTDGGSNWSTLATLATDLNDVVFTASNTGYAVGKTGSVYKTANGGISWNALTSGVTLDLTSVYFASSTTGYIVGQTGTILKTTNSGTTWTPQMGGGLLNFNSVYFPTANIGYAVAGTGYMVSTINGGSSWTSQYSTTTNNLYSDFFTSPAVGYAVGASGTIIKTIFGVPGWYKYAMEDSSQAFMNNPVVIHVLDNDQLNAPLNAYNYIANPEVCDYPYIYGPLQSEHGGTLSIMNADSIQYTPPAGFTGWDNFLYGICDHGNTYEVDTARVFVNVVPASFLNLDPLNGGVNDSLYVSSFPVTLDAGTGWLTYEWSNGGTAQTTSVSSNGWYYATVTLASKFVSTDSIYVLLTTYGQLYKQDKNIAVYPNPAGSEVNVEINEDATLEVVNIQGQILFIKPLAAKTNIVDVSGLSSGVYALRIRTNNGVVIRKLIKK